MKDRVLRALFLITYICWICCGALLAQEERRHVVRPGETFYSIAKAYGVTVDDLVRANPSMGGAAICGTEIIIPTPSADGAGSVTRRDVRPVTTEETDPTDTEAEATPDAVPATDDIRWPSAAQADYNVAVVLPFELAASTADAVRTRMRSVEFYQGFLLALEDVSEATGRKFHVQAHDLSTKRIARVLAAPEMDRSDLIIGPMESRDVPTLAEYGEARGVTVVTPFTFDLAAAKRYPHLFQLNTSKSQMYPALTQDLLHRFENPVFVFLTDSTELSNKEDYAEYLRTELSRDGSEWYDFGYNDPVQVSEMDSLLGVRERNVVYVPVTASRTAMQRVFPYLQFQYNTADSTATRALLGYPEWQTYPSEYMEYFYNLGVYMFTKIYINPFEPEVQAFYDRFKRWYGKEPMSLYPRYALLGYDIGLYFLTALAEQGRDIRRGVATMEVGTLQSAMTYRPYAGGGYINKSLYLVHFTPQSTIEKYVIR